MAFTYSTDLDTSRDKIRFNIGDRVENEGKRPDGANFSDEEIAFALSEEDSRVNGATAYLFEILANEWSSYALSERGDSGNFDATGVAAEFRKQAEKWRKKPGGASTAERGAVIVQMTRYDAWTEAAESEYT